MGIITGLANLISGGGNFRFIAQNMAAIYSVMKDTPFGQSLDNSHLLFATALADVQAYFMTGEIEEDDLSDAVSSALARRVSVNFYSKNCYEYFDYEENMDLICLTMQIEAMLFALSSNVDYRVVVDQVIAHKKVIAKTIHKSLDNITDLKIYGSVYANVTAWAADSTFQNIVCAYTGIEHEQQERQTDSIEMEAEEENVDYQGIANKLCSDISESFKDLAEDLEKMGEVFQEKEAVTELVNQYISDVKECAKQAEEKGYSQRGFEYHLDKIWYEFDSAYQKLWKK